MVPAQAQKPDMPEIFAAEIFTKKMKAAAYYASGIFMKQAGLHGQRHVKLALKPKFVRIPKPPPFRRRSDVLKIQLKLEVEMMAMDLIEFPEFGAAFPPLPESETLSMSDSEKSKRCYIGNGLSESETLMMSESEESEAESGRIWPSQELLTFEEGIQKGIAIQKKPYDKGWRAVPAQAQKAVESQGVESKPPETLSETELVASETESRDRILDGMMMSETSFSLRHPILDGTVAPPPSPESENGGMVDYTGYGEMELGGPRKSACPC